MQVINGAIAKRHQSSAPTPLIDAYAHFRLDRQSIPCSKATMLTYEYTLGAFLRWVAREHPEVRRFEDQDWAEFIAIPPQIGLQGLRR